MKIETIDLGFMGAEGVTASFLLLVERAAALVETGPATCLENLMRGLDERGVFPEDVRQVFLTHVHLDHAGAAGHVAGLLPNTVFYVHEIDRPHLADPRKLVSGAARVYGERMDELWGKARSVPGAKLVALSGGEEAEAADGVLVAHHTPGHARHHLAFHEPESGTLFAVDVAGIRLSGSSHVRPPTSPPEMDPEAWAHSIRLVREVMPRSISPTHFGHFEDVERHLDELERCLKDWLSFAEKRVDSGLTRGEISDELTAKAEAELLADAHSPGDSTRYELAGGMGVFVDGLLQYFARRRAK